MVLSICVDCIKRNIFLEFLCFKIAQLLHLLVCNRKKGFNATGAFCSAACTAGYLEGLADFALDCVVLSCLDHIHESSTIPGLSALTFLTTFAPSMEDF